MARLLSIARLCPAPTAGSRCSQSKLVGCEGSLPAQTPPPERQAGKGCQFWGCFPACRWVPAQPTHGSIRKALTGLSNCLQLTAALGGAAPARAPPNPNRGARALPRHHAGTCGGVLLSKGAPKPKLAAGKVRRGPGQPAPRCSNMAETKAFPPAAPVNSDTDLN